MKNQSQSGVTLIDLLIVLTVVGVIGFIGLGVFVNILSAVDVGPLGPSAVKERAEINLRQWSEENGLKAGGCTSNDSDGDGNVSCTATNPNSGQLVKTLCAHGINQRGCKLPDVQFVPQSSQY